MKEITSVYCINGYLYFYDEDETQEIKVSFHADNGDEVTMPSVDLDKVIYVLDSEKGMNLDFNEKEVFDLIEKADLEDEIVDAVSAYYDSNKYYRDY